MNALEQFKRKVQLPDGFGAAQPYVRLAAVDEGGEFGADADVEFDEGTVTVTVTEWEKAETGTARVPVMRVAFDAASGAILGSEDGAEALPNLLVAVDGMRVLGEGDA